jgi:hypothetical protein
MLISYHGRPVNDFLEVIALSDHEWRVCDGRIDPSDASRLIAFIELENGSYEVLRLGSRECENGTTGACENFDCLAAALAALSAAPTTSETPPANQPVGSNAQWGPTLRPPR